MTGVFYCHCGNTGVVRTLSKSQRAKLTLEKKILPPLLTGLMTNRNYKNESVTVGLTDLIFLPLIEIGKETSLSWTGHKRKQQGQESKRLG